jgi:hypothetical protein
LRHPIHGRDVDLLDQSGGRSCGVGLERRIDLTARRAEPRFTGTFRIELPATRDFPAADRVNGEPIPRDADPQKAFVVLNALFFARITLSSKYERLL